MRKFYLDIGTLIELNTDNVFLENPTGLGATLDPPLLDLKDGFFRVANNTQIPNETITADLIVKGYAEYRQLADLLISLDEFDFGYAPAGQMYSRRVKLSSLGKTEINEGTKLRCPIVLKALEPWSLDANIPWTLSSDEYATLYGKAYEGERLVPSAQMPFAFSVKTTGGAIPKMIAAWETLEGGTAPTMVIIPNSVRTQYDGGVFEYSNDPRDSYIRVTKNGVTEDIINKVPFTNNIFGRVKSAEAKAFIIFDEDESDIPTMTGHYFEFYRSV